MAFIVLSSNEGSSEPAQWFMRSLSRAFAVRINTKIEQKHHQNESYGREAKMTDRYRPREMTLHFAGTAVLYFYNVDNLSSRITVHTLV